MQILLHPWISFSQIRYLSSSEDDGTGRSVSESAGCLWLGGGVDCKDIFDHLSLCREALLKCAETSPSLKKEGWGELWRLVIFASEDWAVVIVCIGGALVIHLGRWLTRCGMFLHLISRLSQSDPVAPLTEQSFPSDSLRWWWPTRINNTLMLLCLVKFHMKHPKYFCLQFWAFWHWLFQTYPTVDFCTKLIPT